MTATTPHRMGIPTELLGSLVWENASEFAILTASFDGRITGWSPGAARIFGYAEDEAVGMSVSALYTASDLSAGVDRQELMDVQRSGRAEDSRWHRRKSGRRFWGNGVSLRIEHSELHGMLKIVRDETRQKRAEEQRILLLHELNHRIKNILATVQSIADQTLRAGNVDVATRKSLTSRLVALSEAHNVLVEESWAGADLEAIVRKSLAPREGAWASRFDFDGPPIRLNAYQSVAMAMAVHELATNAVKYGSLSSPQGRVRVAWNFSLDGEGQRHMTFLWEESGGPTVSEPKGRGFGSRLIERSFNRQNGGRARIDYRPEGLCCAIELGLSGPEEAPLMDVEQAKANG